MLMSGILLAINVCSCMLGYFKVNKIEWEVMLLKNDETANARKIASGEQERTNLIIIMVSGLVGSAIMFGWDFLAFNNTSSCEFLFSGDTFFRNILCFLLKIVSMQLNPAAIYYVMYYSRREDFEQTGNDRLNEEFINYFDDGASDMNRTVSGYARNSELRESSRKASQYG
jgi:hypothetical protein